MGAALAFGLFELEAGCPKDRAAMLISFIYHDVVEGTNFGESGFVDAAADSYKLDAASFRAHLEVIAAERAHASYVKLLDPDNLVTSAEAPGTRLLLTFDDGGVSAVKRTASLLESFGLRGFFFIATDFIGTKGFVHGEHIRDLHARGHGIGSHSASHPMRMANCSRDEMDTEWKKSTQVLADLIDSPVVAASVPGGYYSKAVAAAASCCGIRLLFTSEPTTKLGRVGSCAVLGRYSVKALTAPAEIGKLARAGAATRLRYRAVWDGKKVLKRLGGRGWLALRNRYFARRKSP